MPVNPLVPAHSECCRVDERKPGHLPDLGRELEKGQVHEHPAGQGDEPGIGDKPRKVALEMHLNVVEVVGLEVPKPDLVEVDHDGHHLAHA